ncbi:MAG TPA: polysaccharide deacetylase family protein [Thermoanaerobaculia bacterium]|nr:polysaccharide deacetylase family protein [Thermoanaerobaculia bacterium]
MSCAVFLLHRVAPGAADDRWGLTVDPHEFAALLRRLVASGTLVSLPEALEHLARGGRARVTALTFDDGYADLLHHAFPLLAELDAPATVFLATRYVEDGTPFWWEALRWLSSEPRRLPGLAAAWGLPLAATPEETVDTWCRHFKRLAPARRDALLAGLDCPPGVPRALAVAELAHRPRSCLLGCHGHSHTVLTALSAAAVAAELEHSCRRIAAWSGTAPGELAFPNGQPDDFGADHLGPMRAVGLRAALTTVDGLNTPGADPYRLRRITVRPGQGLAQVEEVLSGAGGGG